MRVNDPALRLVEGAVGVDGVHKLLHGSELAAEAVEPDPGPSGLPAGAVTLAVLTGLRATLRREPCCTSHQRSSYSAPLSRTCRSQRWSSSKES